jgi:2',3'-cyclic-nucleotide 2'-phosphodiesterase (5'-nucleotidase family)
MDRWHPLSDATRGKGNTELLNKAGYDAVTIGNNEGITMPYEDLDTMYEESKFKVLIANLYRQDGSRPEWAQPYETYITKSGTRIGVIGLTANFTRFYNMLGWKVSDPMEELASCISSLKGKTDLIILLSHLGINEDESIGERFPEIDLIFGGHTHHILHEGKVAGNALLGAAGKYGQFTGHAIIEVDPRTKEIQSKKAYLYDMNEWDEAEMEREHIQGYYERGKDLLSKPIIKLPQKLEASYFGDSPLAEILCRTLREWCKADCAFLNAGLLLHSLEKGNVTDYDLLSVCPHPINPCTLQLTGAQLKEVLIQTKDEKWPHLQIKGLGFRGTVMGKFVYDGVEFSGQKIFIDHKPLELKKTYILAIPDMFTFGRFFTEIYRSEHKTYYLPEFLRDLLKWKIMQLYN